MSVPAIDFKTLKVLAVTRAVSEALETKVLYLKPDGDTSILYFKCSNEEHDILAKDFKTFLANKCNQTWVGASNVFQYQ